jgi:hypothetical protein
MLARYWNTVRRVTFHYGCPVALRACAEIERTSKPLALMEPFDEIMQAQMPNTYMLQKWQDMYQSERSSVFKADNMIYFDFGNFTVSIFKHRWDIGGYVSSIKAGGEGKSHFAINTGLADMIKVTGRNPGKGNDKAKLPPINLDLGATFRELGVGGGHHQAASCGFPLGTSPTTIIRDLCTVIGKRISEGREKMTLNETSEVGES